MERKLLTLALLSVFTPFGSTGLSELSLKIPFISLVRQRQPPPVVLEGHHDHDSHHHHAVIHEEPHHIAHHESHHHVAAYHHTHHDDDHHHHNILDHSHVDDQGKIYVHDPESTVRFFYKENMHGPSNLVDVHTSECRDVPLDYWYNRPKSLWAKHCIILYQSGHCKGRGVQVAGSVLELRSAGMLYGVNSFKPCEKNIRIRFLPSIHHKPDDHHSSHKHR